MKLACGAFLVNLSRTTYTHIQFSVREFFLYFFSVSRHQQVFFPASVENGLKRDREKRDAIKMKLVPKRRPQAKFYIRQACSHVFIH